MQVGRVREEGRGGGRTLVWAGNIGVRILGPLWIASGPARQARRMSLDNVGVAAMEAVFGRVLASELDGQLRYTVRMPRAHCNDSRPTGEMGQAGGFQEAAPMPSMLRVQ